MGFYQMLFLRISEHMIFLFSLFQWPYLFFRILENLEWLLKTAEVWNQDVFGIGAFLRLLSENLLHASLLAFDDRQQSLASLGLQLHNSNLSSCFTWFSLFVLFSHLCLLSFIRSDSMDIEPIWNLGCPCLQILSCICEDLTFK